VLAPESFVAQTPQQPLLLPLAAGPWQVLALGLSVLALKEEITITKCRIQPTVQTSDASAFLYIRLKL
jgi:hypothetical protein